MFARSTFVLIVCYLYIYDCVVLPELNFFDDVTIINNETDCDVALRQFAEASSNFTYCTVRFSRPIQICGRCVDTYTDLLRSHENILSAQVNGTKCKDKLINVDRLEVVESTFFDMLDMWKRGYCDKCFDWNDGKPTPSNQTKLFISYFETAKSCINNHTQDINVNNTDKICEDCMNDYITLNSFYESLKGTSETVGICMDIVDAMNATRSVWSDVLNCCRLRRTPELIFLCCTGVVTVLPAIFYILARLYCESSSKPKIIGQNRLAETLQCSPSTSRMDQ